MKKDLKSLLSAETIEVLVADDMAIIAGDPRPPRTEGSRRAEDSRRLEGSRPSSERSERSEPSGSERSRPSGSERSRPSGSVRSTSSRGESNLSESDEYTSRGERNGWGRCRPSCRASVANS